MSTPKEVFSALAADFRKRNLSYEDVANLTGYKKQTIANFIASRKDYLSQGQASRFAQAFGEDSGKLVAVLSMLSRYLYFVDDPALTALYRNMLNLINETDGKKAYEYVKNQEKIFDLLAKANGVAFPDVRDSED